jgi:hypothetical protein
VQEAAVQNRTPRSDALDPSVNSATPRNAERAPEPPRYGQAAAIYALYQQGFTAPETKPRPPRKPGGGKLVHALEGAARLLRGLVPVPA